MDDAFPRTPNVSVVVKAVMMITGILGSMVLMLRNASRPDMSGRRTSRRTTSGMCVRTAPIASMPLLARRTFRWGDPSVSPSE